MSSKPNMKIRRRTLVSFAVFALLIFAGLTSWNYLYRLPKDSAEGDRLRKPVRKVLGWNEKVFSAIFSNEHLAKTYPKSRAVKNVRYNGGIGLKNTSDTAAWSLHLVRANGDTQFISLKEIKALPKTEIIFDFKCIEGWSQVTHWGGVRLSDLVKAYGLEKEAERNYIGLYTPDKQYYVGIDMAGALHPQTLLCYEMNGKPLPLKHGAPLRLIIPVKYGIKNLKRIGTLYFSDTKPPDYWAERGYDYYSGL